MTADDARARRIEAGAKAIPLANLASDPLGCIAAAVLDAVEPIILADLRAKVEGLPEVVGVWQVLALLDEVQP